MGRGGPLGRATVREVLIVLCMAAAAGPGWAEMSGDDYSPPAAGTDDATRALVAAELEAQRRAAALAAAAAAERERERLARAEAQRRQRPIGAQLLEARCSACHATAVTEGLGRGPLGWRFTVERMRWWHGAALPAGEAATIARHLSQTQPATVWRVIGEWLLAGAALASGPGVWWFASRRRRAVSEAS